MRGDAPGPGAVGYDALIVVESAEVARLARAFRYRGLGAETDPPARYRLYAIAAVAP